MKRRMTQKNETSFLNYIIPPILIRFTSTVRSCDQGEQKDESNKRAENMSKNPGFSSPRNVENWSGTADLICGDKEKTWDRPTLRRLSRTPKRRINGRK